MHPTIVGTVQSYTVCLVLADLVGLTVAFMCASRSGVPLRRFACALLLLTAAAFAGAKLYGLIERGGALGVWQAELVSGYRYPGAVVAVATTALLLSRLSAGLSAGTLLDLVTPAFGFALVVVRLGCLLAGCCNGSVSAAPWAMRFPAHSQLWHAQLSGGLIDTSAPQTLPVHPLQVYFGMLAFAAGLTALWLERRKRYAGQVFLLFVAMYGAGQFLLEFLRARPLAHVQYLCGTLAIGAVTILIARGLVWRRDVRQPRAMTEVRA
jgi:phosphatidylglycerol:prolipoprotein diacylglycerol transferase